MNFKIENRIIHISNYPSVERHLEDMAGKGWMLNRIILSNIFIYKKVNPEDLDFSIVPYENETLFNKKNKTDVEEFKNKNEKLGWKFISKAYNFHIYCEEKNFEAVDIIPSAREELSILENIGKTQSISYYVLFALFLFFFWNLLKGFKTDVIFLKYGLGQLLLALMPVILIVGIVDLIAIKRFIKTNRKIISQGESFISDVSLEYKDSKLHLQKLSYILAFILLVFFIAYFLFKVILSKETFILLSLIPVTIGAIVGIGFRFFIKPTKMLGEYKVGVLILAIVIGIVFVNIVIVPLMEGSFGDRWKNKEVVDTNGDGVLVVEDFSDSDKTDSVRLSRDISFLIPKSYQYVARNNNDLYIMTDYSYALTEGIANNLVGRYKYRVENQIDNWSDYSLEEYYQSRTVYGSYILESGVTEKDLDKIKDQEIEDYKEIAKNLMKERSILKADSKLWNVDEAYYLDFSKEDIVLRKGKEVYYLSGVDFSDGKVIRIVMEKLGLN